MEYKQVSGNTSRLVGIQAGLWECQHVSGITSRLVGI